MKFSCLIIFLLLVTSCNQQNKILSAQGIVDKTIENAGGEKYENADIQFQFREIQYSSSRKKGAFELTRTITDSVGKKKDVLNNQGFQRFLNGEKMALPDSVQTKYTNSLNSVHYFVQLPYGLNDAAVKKELVGETEIKGKEYYEIKISFAEDGGGTDHGDIYMYWINKEDFAIDYFAYKFYTGEGGIRFRTAYNPRTIKGIRFVDYKNYKIEPYETVDLQNLGELLEEGKLELLSDIKTEAISVNLNKS